MNNIDRAWGEAFLLMPILFIGRGILFELPNIFLNINRGVSELVSIGFLVISSIFILRYRNKGKRFSILYGVIASVIMLYFVDARGPSTFFTGMAIVAVLPFVYQSLPLALGEGGSSPVSQDP